MVRQEKADLSSVKKLLTSFVLNRPGDSTAQLEAELGDLLLFMIHLADKEGVDLIRAGQRQVERRARSAPVAVRGGKR
jgi:NTP pyrophosphatase (non-canonical NTP hydrolase)